MLTAALVISTVVGPLVTVKSYECEHKAVLARDGDYVFAVAYHLTHYFSGETNSNPACANPVVSTSFKLFQSPMPASLPLKNLGHYLPPLNDGTCPNGTEALYLAKRDSMPFSMAGATTCLPEDYLFVPGSKRSTLSRHYKVISARDITYTCPEADSVELEVLESGTPDLRLGCIPL
jgi:hypothetical protein